MSETTTRPPFRGEPARAAVCCLALAIVSLAGVGHAASETLKLRLGSIEVDYHSGDADLARQAARAVQRAHEIISRDLGINFTQTTRIAIAAGREEFGRLCGDREPDWALAVALRHNQGVVVNASHVTPATANDLRLVIIHETTHLALFTLEENRSDRLPIWFHEGVATWLSGIRHLRGHRRTFTVAAEHGKLIPLDRLEKEFPREASRANLAYLESEAFIAHLVATRSTAALRWILDAYRHGASFDDAFHKAVGATRAEVEAEWSAGLRSRYPWLKTLWRLASLTLIMAVATILVFVVIRWRRWRQRRAWEAEEAWAAVLDEEEPNEPEDDEDSDDGRLDPPWQRR